MKTIYLLVALLLAISICAVAQPNVVFMVADDLGTQVGCYGQREVRTPHIDALANRSTLFTKGYVVVSSCSPSRASMLTGLYPHQNGQVCLAQFANCRMTDGIQTIVHVLRYQKNYVCGSIGKVHVEPVPPYHSNVGIGVPAGRDYRTWRTHVRNFLSSCTGKPFFLWIGFPEAHRSFVAQHNGRPTVPLYSATPLDFMQVDSPAVRQDTALYLDGIMRLDDCVWAVMKELQDAGRESNTMIVFVGDNGAPYARAKTTAYEAGTRVPFIIKHPMQTTKRVVNSLVATVDLVPTICEETSATMPFQPAGSSLFRLVRGQPEPNWRQYLVTEMNWHMPSERLTRRAITDGNHKMIFNLFYPNLNNVWQQGEPTLDASRAPGVPAVVRTAYDRYLRPPQKEMFDLIADPYELVDISNRMETATTQSLMIKEMRDWQYKTSDPYVGTP